MNNSKNIIRLSTLTAAIALAAAAPAFAATPESGWADTQQTSMQTETQTVLVVDSAPATLPQWQPPAITRESVREELRAAREAGTLTPTNEVGDTDRVLAAREAFNQQQTQEIVAAYQAEYDRQVALQEAEIRRAAIEADWVLYGMVQPSDDPTAEVQIDVISMEPLGVGE